VQLKATRSWDFESTSCRGETGNTVNGNYSQTITAGDSYIMTETGTNPGGAFIEVVTGSDAATLTESGNPATQTFNRTITGDGTYTRTDSGPGATLSNVPNGSITYTLQETGDTLGAVFDQTETGGDRYSLLEHFVNLSNTGGGNTPGNMNFYPFGLAFVDPPPGSLLLRTGPPYSWDDSGLFQLVRRGLFGTPTPRMVSVPITSLTGRTLQCYIESLETLAASHPGDAAAGRLTAAQTRNLLALLRQQGWKASPRGVEMNWRGGAHINLTGPSGQSLHLPVPAGFVP
jgi:hypothetical protein